MKKSGSHAGFSILQTVLEGIAIIPIRVDRTKAPLGTLKGFQVRLPTEAESLATMNPA